MREYFMPTLIGAAVLGAEDHAPNWSFSDDQIANIAFMVGYAAIACKVAWAALVAWKELAK